MDRAEALQRVTTARVGRLATVTPAGQAHVVPITFTLLEGHVVHAIDHKPKTTTRLQRLVNIEANPSASFLVDHYEEDWERLWWVRIDGTAAVLDGPQGRAAVAGLAEKYPAYRDRPPQGPVVEVRVERVRWWESRR